MQALMPLAGDYGIEARHLLAVIEGCQMDLQQTRYLDYPALQRYCHLVAGVVGEVAARIFGQTEEQTTRYAHTLGLAFQLTNIIRDVGEDALRGRIYLPVNELQQFDVKAHEILERQYSERFTALMQFQAERAHRLYDEALALLPAADRRAQKPGLMMASIYRTLLREIERDQLPGAAPAHQPHAPAQALAGLARAGAREACEGRHRRRRLGRPGRRRGGHRRPGHQVDRLRGLPHARRPGPCGGSARLPDGRTVTLDNGQHILIGAYTETLRLMRDGRRGPGRGAAAPAADAAIPRRRRPAAAAPAGAAGRAGRHRPRTRLAAARTPGPAARGPGLADWRASSATRSCRSPSSAARSGRRSCRN